jgi:hypothetical protein
MHATTKSDALNSFLGKSEILENINILLPTKYY